MEGLKVRISRGVSSSPKLWALAFWRGGSDHAGEFDVSDSPGWIDGTAMGGMTGTVRRPDGTWTWRKCYGSVDEWAEDVAAEWPGAEILRADDEPLKWTLGR